MVFDDLTNNNKNENTKRSNSGTVQSVNRERVGCQNVTLYSTWTRYHIALRLLNATAKHFQQLQHDGKNGRNVCKELFHSECAESSLTASATLKTETCFFDAPFGWCFDGSRAQPKSPVPPHILNVYMCGS